jgi:chemotaxis protein MotB
MQAEINTINSAVSERDKEIEFLNNQIKEAIKFIGSGREDNVTLSENNEYLQGELKNVQEAQDELSSRLTEVTSEKEKVVADLRWEVSALNERLSREQETATGLRQELGDLAVKLRSTAAGKARIEEDLDEARQALSADKKTMESRLAEIAGLKRDIAALETARAGLEGKVADMGLKLESAAERNARGLSTYRSEFFGRLREVFGDDPDIRMVGDRFVFQSEVLFPSVSAELNPDGQSTLTQLAETLKEVAKKIPADVNWMLRIDGHTDRVPIKTWAYESNWELSTARAMSVVKFLVRLGLAPEHLAATGFGEYRALDPRDDEIAYRHNRRIEFKLTQ